MVLPVLSVLPVLLVLPVLPEWVEGEGMGRGGGECRKGPEGPLPRCRPPPSLPQMLYRPRLMLRPKPATGLLPDPKDTPADTLVR